MKHYESGAQVASGYYFNTSAWELAVIDEERSFLQGTRDTRWYRLNSPMAIVAAALVSLGFVLFLPVIGLVLFFKVVSAALLDGVKRATESLVHALAPRWQPGEAWFARRDAAAEKPAEEQPAEEPSEALRKEVAERRADEEQQ